MLIDCGVHLSVTGGADKVREIVADIASVTKRIDVLVVTHEHWDHVSGFISASDEFAGIAVGDVWFAWTENPKDREAQSLDKFKADALTALQLANSTFASMGVNTGLAHLGGSLANVLGFHFGAKGEKVRSARDAARDLATGKVVYHEPGTDPIELPNVPGVRVFVLGPPHDDQLIRLEERASEMYGLAGGAALAQALTMAMSTSVEGSDWTAPFDADLGHRLDELLPVAQNPADRDTRPVVALLRHHYAGPALASRTSSRKSKRQDEADLADQSWRRIDHDWLAIAADLALQLDKGVNNTSLVLAFELEPDGRVLLFPGDAQVGNWLSWQNVRFGDGEDAITGPDLLKRTVYLKVAHHGSHNATLKAKGLELMRDPDLTAFIPVNKNDAVKVKWHQMPFEEILDSLDERTHGRVIRADDSWVQTGRVPNVFSRANGSIRSAVRCKPGLWVELDVA